MRSTGGVAVALLGSLKRFLCFVLLPSSLLKHAFLFLSHLDIFQSQSLKNIEFMLVIFGVSR